MGRCGHLAPPRGRRRPNRAVLGLGGLGWRGLRCDPGARRLRRRHSRPETGRRPRGHRGPTRISWGGRQRMLKTCLARSDRLLTGTAVESKGTWTSWGWGRRPITTSFPAWYVSPERLSPWFHPSLVTQGRTHPRRRCLTPTLLRLRGHHDLWVRAQRDTHAEHLLALLALLNREAHHLAARGASTSTLWAVPLCHLLPAAVVLHYHGGPTA